MLFCDCHVCVCCLDKEVCAGSAAAVAAPPSQQLLVEQGSILVTPLYAVLHSDSCVGCHKQV